MNLRVLRNYEELANKSEEIAKALDEGGASKQAVRNLFSTILQLDVGNLPLAIPKLRYHAARHKPFKEVQEDLSKLINGVARVGSDREKERMLNRLKELMECVVANHYFFSEED